MIYLTNLSKGQVLQSTQAALHLTYSAVDCASNSHSKGTFLRWNVYITKPYPHYFSRKHRVYHTGNWSANSTSAAAAAALLYSPALQCASITGPALLIFSLFLLFLLPGIASVPKASLPCRATVLILWTVSDRQTAAWLYKILLKRKKRSG